jgi:hypothetical protein
MAGIITAEIRDLMDRIEQLAAAMKAEAATEAWSSAAQLYGAVAYHAAPKLVAAIRAVEARFGPLDAPALDDVKQLVLNLAA